MPQSANSPTSTNSKAGSDDNSSSRLSEAAARKKKNADAQAAFRARRANYIATLEETVTNLESVVLQLQDSCREAKNESAELRLQNVRLRNENRDLEKFWRAMWQARKSGQLPDDDFPLPSYATAQTPNSGITPPMGPHANHYSEEGLRFPASGNPSPSLSNASYHPAATPDYPDRSPAMGFAGIESDANGENRPQHTDPQQIPRYGPYPPYPIDNTRDANWTHPSNSAIETSPMNSNGCPSPSYVESPSLAATELNYTRFSVGEDQKVPIAPINTSSYMFPNSRSISPAASTPTSTSSTSLAPAPFPFTFPEGSVVQDRPEFNYRRQNGGQPELTLHGGTADLPIAGSSGDALRYRLGNNRSDRPLIPAISPYSRRENGSHDRESDESESAPYHYTTRARQRRSTANSRSSRSPSPGPPAICGTLAVIKAQAFGALRRTRNRTRKSSEGAAKAAVEALEARGIGMGINVSHKRPRLHDDNNNEPQT